MQIHSKSKFSRPRRKEVLITASAKSNTGVQREASTMAPFLKAGWGFKA